MTTTPPEAPATAPSQGPRVTRDDLRAVERLRRTVGSDRYVAGVSGGVARHLDIDPAIVRVIFVVLVFFGGGGLLLYGALWLLLPEEGSEHAVVSLDSRSLTVAIVAVLGLAAVLLVGDSWGGFGFPWPLTVVGIIVAVVLLTRDKRELAAPTPYSPGTPTTPYGARPVGSVGSVQTVGTRPSMAPGARGVPDVPRPAAPARPRDPRRSGPVLFWFTLACLALGAGVLGVADVSGLDVPGTAYPALALATVAVMLLTGAFYGRAGGLILLGLLITPVLALSMVADNYEGDVRTETPLTAADVPSTYSMGAGELVVDLSRISDPERLDGRAIAVDGGLARLEVILPDDVDVAVSASVDGPGNISVFGSDDDSFDTSTFTRQDVRDEVATFSLDVTLGVGEIIITSK